MFGNGMEREVIIRILPKLDKAQSMFGETEVTYEYERLRVWANKDLKLNFQSIPGVIYADLAGVATCYTVFIDPRYDLKWVMAEIEAVARTEAPKLKITRKKKDSPPIELPPLPRSLDNG